MEMKEREVKQRLSVKDLMVEKAKTAKRWCSENSDTIACCVMTAGGMVAAFMIGRLSGMLDCCMSITKAAVESSKDSSYEAGWVDGIRDAMKVMEDTNGDAE